MSIGTIIVLVILAFEVVRRSRARQTEPVMASEPLSSKRDEDPLSRGASEWERYAAQLAAAGRLREAIRAWYHAVLVTLYGANILHYRKGRTNWEYVAGLAPAQLCRCEQGEQLVKVGFLERLAAALDIAPTALLPSD